MFVVGKEKVDSRQKTVEEVQGEKEKNSYCSMSLIVVQLHYVLILQAFEKCVPFHVENEEMQVQKKKSCFSTESKFFDGNRI